MRRRVKESSVATGSPRAEVLQGGPRTSERWLIRFGYDGQPFAGWARQPHFSTVEGEILEGLVRRHIAPSARVAALEVASRTDRGVGARANALGLSSDLDAQELLHRLNSISPSIWFTAARRIPRSFRVRRATRRVYHYFEMGQLEAPTRVRRAARLLLDGVDTRSFGRGVSDGRPRRVPLERISFRPVPGGYRIEVAAPGFVWGMVRKIVGALREVDQGRLTLEHLGAAARGTSRLTLPMAEPEGLILWDVEYPAGWEWTWTGPTRQQQAHRERLRRETFTRSATMRALTA